MSWIFFYYFSHWVLELTLNLVWPEWLVWPIERWRVIYKGLLSLNDRKTFSFHPGLECSSLAPSYLPTGGSRGPHSSVQSPRRKGHESSSWCLRLSHKSTTGIMCEPHGQGSWATSEPHLQVRSAALLALPKLQGYGHNKYLMFF